MKATFVITEEISNAIYSAALTVCTVEVYPCNGKFGVLPSHAPLGLVCSKLQRFLQKASRGEMYGTMNNNEIKYISKKRKNMYTNMKISLAREFSVLAVEKVRVKMLSF